MFESINFKPEEFACPCCGKVPNPQEHPNHQRLLNALEELRKTVNKPIIITSGLRCEKHNKEIGGESGSFHLYGMAADIVVNGFSSGMLKAQAIKVDAFKNGGIGFYPVRGHLHVDVRENGPARWNGDCE